MLDDRSARERLRVGGSSLLAFRTNPPRESSTRRSRSVAGSLALPAVSLRNEVITNDVNTHKQAGIGILTVSNIMHIHRMLTTISIGFGAITILKTVRPGAFVFGSGRGGLANAVTTFEALRPFSSVEPATSGFHSKSMTFAVLPLPFKGAPTAKTNINSPVHTPCPCAFPSSQPPQYVPPSSKSNLPPLIPLLPGALCCCVPVVMAGVAGAALGTLLYLATRNNRSKRRQRRRKAAARSTPGSGGGWYTAPDCYLMARHYYLCCCCFCCCEMGDLWKIMETSEAESCENIITSSERVEENNLDEDKEASNLSDKEEITSNGIDVAVHNPAVTENIQEDLDLIKGDMIGDTIYSERWVLKTLMTITQKYSDYCQDEVRELESSVEEDLCTLWDMSAESDVARYLVNHHILDLIASIIDQCQNARLMEIMIGVLGNLTCQTEIRSKVEENGELVKSLVTLLRYPDTLALVQIVRLIRTCMWEMRDTAPTSSNSWIIALSQKEACESLAFILKNSVEEDLLTATLKLLETLVCIKLPNTDGHFEKLYGTSVLVESMNEGLNELVSDEGQDVETEDSESQEKMHISSKQVEEACRMWVSILYSISSTVDGQQSIRQHGGHIIKYLELILRHFLDQDNWKDSLDDHIYFLLCGANLLGLLLPTEFSRGCFVCVVTLLERLQGLPASALEESLEECIVSVTAAEGVQSQMLAALDECHAPEVELCFRTIAKNDRALLAQLLAEVSCTQKHQRLCDIANQVLSVHPTWNHNPLSGDTNYLAVELENGCVWWVHGWRVKAMISVQGRREVYVPRVATQGQQSCDA
ncbi:hypothetical protein B566_EDAN006034 [Ephemera danica]|nr:hypothetical protein B566_EDAN006034 [Ephemera danica]